MAYRQLIRQLPLCRADFGNKLREEFPVGMEGDKLYYEYRLNGDNEFFKYFVDNMFLGPSGTGKLQASVFITGQLGAGKTCLMVSLGWRIRELYGLPVSTDFTAIYPDLFGEYEYVSDRDLIDELVKISEGTESLARRKRWSAEVADEVMNKNRSKLYKHVVLWDEIYKKVSNRRGQEILNVLIGDIMKQQRHFKSLFISAAPAENEIDRKSWNQYVNVDISGTKLNPHDDEPDREDYTYFHVWNRAINMETAFTFWRKPWHRLYNSESPPTIRQKLTSEDLAKAYKVVFCPDCGKKFPNDNLYCPDCGSHTKRPSTCTNPDCGSMILPKNRFCPKCGKENIDYKGKESKTVEEEKREVMVI